MWSLLITEVCMLQQTIHHLKLCTGFYLNVQKHFFSFANPTLLLPNAIFLTFLVYQLKISCHELLLLPAQTLQLIFFQTSTSIDHSSFSLMFQSGVQTRLFTFVLKSRPQPILLCFIKFDLTGKHLLQLIICLAHWCFGLVV